MYELHTTKKNYKYKKNTNILLVLYGIYDRNVDKHFCSAGENTQIQNSLGKMKYLQSICNLYKSTKGGGETYIYHMYINDSICDGDIINGISQFRDFTIQQLDNYMTFQRDRIVE